MTCHPVQDRWTAPDCPRSPANRFVKLGECVSSVLAVSTGSIMRSSSTAANNFDAHMSEGPGENELPWRTRHSFSCPPSRTSEQRSQAWSIRIEYALGLGQAESDRERKDRCENKPWMFLCAAPCGGLMCGAVHAQTVVDDFEYETEEDLLAAWTGSANTVLATSDAVSTNCPDVVLPVRQPGGDRALHGDDSGGRPDGPQHPAVSRPGAFPSGDWPR